MRTGTEPGLVGTNGRRAECLDLAGSCGPFLPSRAALVAARDSLREVWRYPEERSTRLRAALADCHAVEPDAVLVGNGSDEILDLLLRAAVRPGDEGVVPAWSFPRVRVLLRACGAVPVDAPMVDGKVSLESIAARVGPRTRVVVLANPNNPTGDAFTADALDALVRALPNEVALLLDEAHVDFSAPAYATVGRTLLEHHPGRRIAFVRSFSKARGLAGLRLGYGVGRVAEAAGLLGICSVNAVAQAAGMAALADARHLESVRQACAVSRAALDRLLRTHGWRPQRSEAGFVLAQFDGDAVAFAEALAEVGVRIRSMRDWGLPEGYARFAVGPRWTVTRLAEAMRQVSSR